ncbi:MmcQ/YjbR family DNA-binding protein [Microlunatus speluncae]|uniref:MmcQ/YjbR family DNA-binding protein n=1 Tax=Microlunatus speluncae TaxID=2594267 RepID=UPI001266538A|nr:MmcQ/YjbR family DNA-binding protein [Microlunatus speluncae]
MATVKDVEKIVAGLPEVTTGERHGQPTWFVGGKAFAWHRGFSKADLKRFGDETPPSGPIFAVVVGDLAEKEGVLAGSSAAVFTIPHFDGYAAVLIQLEAIDRKELRELITDAWLAKAPRKLAESFLAG